MRLNFVRGSKRDSDEWTPPTRRLTQQELWDRRRAQELEQQECRHHLPQQQLQGLPEQRTIQLPPQRDHSQLGQQGNRAEFNPHDNCGGRPQINHHSHHSDEDIVGNEDHSHHSHDSHDDHDRMRPHIFREKPTKSQLPKAYKTHAKRSGGHKKKYAFVLPSLEDGSSSDGSSEFTEGYRAGRRSLSRGAVPRGRSRSRFTEDSFEDLMEPRYRSRSRGGRRH